MVDSVSAILVVVSELEIFFDTGFSATMPSVVVRGFVLTVLVLDSVVEKSFIDSLETVCVPGAIPKSPFSVADGSEGRSEVVINEFPVQDKAVMLVSIELVGEVRYSVAVLVGSPELVETDKSDALKFSKIVVAVELVDDAADFVEKLDSQTSFIDSPELVETPGFDSVKSSEAVVAIQLVNWMVESDGVEATVRVLINSSDVETTSNGFMMSLEVAVALKLVVELDFGRLPVDKSELEVNAVVDSIDTLDVARFRFSESSVEVVTSFNISDEKVDAAKVGCSCEPLLKTLEIVYCKVLNCIS